MNPWDHMTPAGRRAALIHCARVYMREAHARRGSAFATMLAGWAANARRQAAAIDLRPAQQDLFAQCDGVDHGRKERG